MVQPTTAGLACSRRWLVTDASTQPSPDQYRTGPRTQTAGAWRQTTVEVARPLACSQLNCRLAYSSGILGHRAFLSLAPPGNPHQSTLESCRASHSHLPVLPLIRHRGDSSRADAAILPVSRLSGRTRRPHRTGRRVRSDRKRRRIANRPSHYAEESRRQGAGGSGPSRRTNASCIASRDISRTALISADGRRRVSAH